MRGWLENVKDMTLPPTRFNGRKEKYVKHHGPWMWLAVGNLEHEGTS